MVDVISIIRDYANEESFQYWTGTDPDGSKWIEIHHHQGGAKAFADGRVVSAVNPKLKAVMERKIAEARIIEEESLTDIEDTGDAWQAINSRLEELTDHQLTKLVEAIRRLQKSRESEKIASSGVS